MNGWGGPREVEKVKPFADRALKVALRLSVLRDSLATMFGSNHDVALEMHRAQLLLEEAAARGVKGKEPKP